MVVIINKLRQNTFSFRNLMILLIVAIVVRENISGIIEISKETGEMIPPWLFPFLFTSPVQVAYMTKNLILFGFLLTIANVPFESPFDIYMKQRVGKTAWYLGIIGYGLVHSFFYYIYINVVIAICAIPRYRWLETWGRIISTMAYSDVYDEYCGFLRFPAKSVVSQYTPFETWLWTFVMLVLISFLLYLTMLLLRILCKAAWISQLVAVFLVCMDYVICYMGMHYWYWFSPVTWISIEIYYRQDTHQPNRIQTFIMTWILVILFFIVSVKVGRDQNEGCNRRRYWLIGGKKGAS